MNIASVLALLCFTSGLFHGTPAADYGPSLLADEDHLCNPSGINFRYSGIRLYQTMLKDLPVRHFWYLVRCNAGKIVAEQYLPTNRSDNFPFGKPVCINNDDCYILSRVKKYAPRMVPLYKPSSKLGVLYKYNATDNSTIPCRPIIADNMAFSLTLSMGIACNMKYIPILYSSMEELPIDWDQKMEVNPEEHYEYTERDCYEHWSYVNSAINNIEKTLVHTDKFVFWEFDALQTQLDGLDWRKYINKAIPNIKT